MSRVSQLNIFFVLGKLFFLLSYIRFLDAYVPKKKKSSNQNTEKTVFINSCICRRITATKILASACQAELIHSENLSYLRRNVMITGLTLTPCHKQDRTVSVLELYSCLWKEF